MNIYKNDLISISKSQTSRLGIAYARESHAEFLNKHFSNCVLRVKDVCKVLKGTAITEKETGDGNIPVVAGGKEAAYYHNSYNRVADVITISASGANAGFVNYWNCPIWASDCTTVQSKDEKKYLTKFIYYLFCLIQEDIFLMQKGADQPHVYPGDIAHLKLPDIDIKEQKNFIKAAQLIEDKIALLKSEKIDTVQEVIDDIFQKEFKFDYAKFEILKHCRFYTSSQHLFSNNQDLRFSAKYHRPAGEFVKKQLFGITDKRIKNFLAEPIVLGASVSPKDYDDTGTCHYISMATIKTWNYNQNSAAIVNDSYALAKATKMVRKGDIIMARSGEGTIGKVAEITGDVSDIFADFTMRIRLKNYNTTFAYFYFRTSFFQYLIEINKKGLGNNTNIFPNIVKEFPIPDININTQNRIVEEINNKLFVQKQNDEKITILQKEINKLLIDELSKSKNCAAIDNTIK